MRLRSNAIQYLAGHGLSPGTWSSSVFVSSNNRDEVRRRIVDAVGSEFTISEMKPWESDPISFRGERWLGRLGRRVKRATKQVRG